MPAGAHLDFWNNIKSKEKGASVQLSQKNQIVKSYQRLAFEKKLSHWDNTP